MIDPADWPWPNFSPREMACRETGKVIFSRQFMDRLQSIRAIFARPLIVSSGYRSPDYNARVSNTGRTGPHTTGHAVDVPISGADYVTVFGLAITAGMTGFGSRQNGPRGGRFLHLDDLPKNGWPRPTGWTY